MRAGRRFVLWLHPYLLPDRDLLPDRAEFHLIPDADQNATLETYFVTIRRVGATVLVGAIGEIENVSHVFQPAGRFSAANSP
jgi:hypothetical protein